MKNLALINSEICIQEMLGIALLDLKYTTALAQWPSDQGSPRELSFRLHMQLPYVHPTLTKAPIQR